MAKQTTAITEFDANKFPVLAPETAQDAISVIADNMGNGGLSVGDLDKITVPPGGGTTFEIPTVDGDTEPSKEISGIILLATEGKGLWAKSMEEEPGAPPVCYSHDCVKGFGDPLGTGEPKEYLCATCPKNQWGSSTTGTCRGKACRDLRPLYLLREGEYLPIVVSVPRKSLKHIKKYMQRLSGKGIPYYGCVTKFTLTKVSGTGVPDYSELIPSFVVMLDKDQRAAVKAYADKLNQEVKQSAPAQFDNKATNGDDYDPFADEAGPEEPRP
jgi:hypothetical protein